MSSIRNILKTTTVYICIFISVIFFGCADEDTLHRSNISPALTENITPTAHINELFNQDKVKMDSIYGVMPVDWVNNDISNEYFPLLVKAYKETISEPDNEHLGLNSFPFQLFAVEPFEKGVLLFAGYTIDQDYPDLYYMKDDRLLFYAVGSEYFSLNYTVFKEHTISYGLTLSDDINVNRSVKTVGAFANGEIVEQISNENKNNLHGYILVAQGQTWLSSIRFFDEKGNFITDEHSYQIGWNQCDYHWKGKPYEVWNVQRYTQMYDNAMSKYAENTLTYRHGEAEDETTPLHVFIDDGREGIQYVWRSHNNLVNQCEANPSQNIKIDNLPPDASIYWVNIEDDTGTDENINKILKEGSLQTPDKPGAYCLIIKSDKLIHTLFIEVISG